ncbi:hypothetical protein EDC01DRAFT_100401 [Geopyxis carbonaria]|nr:hypothetical protein EDC01DRAFT_100401 [Geopyxis carbonaria]
MFWKSSLSGHALLTFFRLGRFGDCCDIDWSGYVQIVLFLANIVISRTVSGAVVIKRRGGGDQEKHQASTPPACNLLHSSNPPPRRPPDNTGRIPPRQGPKLLLPFHYPTIHSSVLPFSNLTRRRPLLLHS